MHKFKVPHIWKQTSVLYVLTYIQIDHTTAASTLTSTVEKNYSVDLYYFH